MKNFIILISEGFIIFLMMFACNSQAQTTPFKKVANAIKNPQLNTTLVVAHRADWRNHPENSLVAIKSCIEIGVDIVEIDVRITKDKQIIVIHDKTLERTSTGTGKISHHTLAEIKRMRLKNCYGMPTDYKIPTLREVLTLTKDKVHLMLDKAYYILPEVWKVVKEVGVENQVLFEGKVSCAELIKTYPKLHKQILYMPRISPKTENLKDYTTAYKNYLDVPMFITSFKKPDKEFLEYIQQLNGEGFNIMATTLLYEATTNYMDEDAVEKLYKNWGWLIEKGFTAICTDRSRLLINYLNTK